MHCLKDCPVYLLLLLKPQFHFCRMNIDIDFFPV